MVTTLLTSAIYIESVLEPLPAFNPLYVLIVGTYVATLLSVLALHLGVSPARIAFAHALWDIAAVTRLVYLAGASEPRAGFMLLYPLAVLAASTLVGRRSAIAIALLAVLSFVGLHLVLRSGWIGVYGPTGARFLGPEYLVYSGLILAVSSVGVAWIGGYLAENLQATGARLEKAADEVLSLRQMNQAIIESIHSGLITVDADGCAVYVNPYGAEILGLSASSVRGLKLAQAFDSPLLGPAILESGVLDARLDRLEMRYKRGDGEVIELGASVAPLTSRDPDLGRYLLVFQDLTEIKTLEREVRLKEKLAAVGEMAAQVAHEIRNPLSSISGSAQLLMADGTTEEQNRLLDIIKRESRRLSENLNQFLFQTRPAPATAIDIRPIIEEAVVLLRSGLSSDPTHDIQYRSVDTSVLCLADADRLKQVFWNLSRNGLEAMPNGGILQVSLQVAESQALIVFEDEGKGLSVEAQARLFRPFESHKPGGTGLGLAIVYHIIRDHRGDISFRGRPSGGTRVEVRLPLVGQATR